MLGRHEAALADAQAALSLAPQRADAHLSLAVALSESGDVAAARESLAQAERLQPPPNLTDDGASPAQHEAKWLRSLAGVRTALAAADGSASGTADLEAALSHLQQAAALQPGSADIQAEADSVHCSLEKRRRQGSAPAAAPAPPTPAASRAPAAASAPPLEARLKAVSRWGLDHAACMIA